MKELFQQKLELEIKRAMKEKMQEHLQIVHSQYMSQQFEPNDLNADLPITPLPQKGGHYINPPSVGGKWTGPPTMNIMLDERSTSSRSSRSSSRLSSRSASRLSRLDFQARSSLVDSVDPIYK